ncbi:helix-turn-helix transcriptional regulator [Crossiella cryophila]|uniref:DNA-binding NarL/FixJ family response regulator n=1 Tax=Crossiella cryophila TaxID=43355 RepID=A0A7W7CEL4_9PSEU|nr:LuxR C-terminal-related transcriptional regulator [Crossiella cryophila]MBB4679680.1 DNA-binding NarL/FixJ family response regulator [Crossiella cryophila]
MDRVLIAVCSRTMLTLPGVTRLLSAEPELEVVGPARIRAAQVALVVAEEVDVDTREILLRVRRSSPARLLLAVNRLTEADLPWLARTKVAAVLERREVDTPTLVAAIAAARHAPESPERLAAGLRARLAGGAVPAQRARADVPVRLAPRERDLLELLADGYGTAEIARRLRYSERTVKNIVHGLLSRFELRNRTHAVAYLLRAGAL